MAKSLFGRAHEIKKNCRITIYPDGSIGEILACSMDIFVPDGWEAVNQDKSISAGCCSDNNERARRQTCFTYPRGSKSFGYEARRIRKKI